MRELKYGIPGKAANNRTFATDPPGHGGASHTYEIKGPVGKRRSGLVLGDLKTLGDVKFQNGPVQEDGTGVNGVQHEDLLAIIIDRLEAFQAGPYACEENAEALLHC